MSIMLLNIVTFFWCCDFPLRSHPHGCHLGPAVTWARPVSAQQGTSPIFFLGVDLEKKSPAFEALVETVAGELVDALHGYGFLPRLSP